MFVFFHRVFEVFGPEIGRCTVDQQINVTVDHLFVGIKAYESFLGRYINILLRFQFISQSVNSVLEHVAQSHNRYSIGGIQEVHGCTRAASAATDHTCFQLFTVSCQIRQLRDIIGTRLFQRLDTIFLFPAAGG